MNPAFNEFAITAVAGAFGGFVGGINGGGAGLRLTLPKGNASREPRQIELGFAGDILVGAAAGIMIVLFLHFGANQSNEFPPLQRLVPLGLMGGVVSKKALAGVSDLIISRLVSEQAVLRAEQTRIQGQTEQLRIGQVTIQDRLKKLDHINELIQEGERYLMEAEEEKTDRSRRLFKVESALKIFLQAAEIDHTHSVAFVCVGKAFKRLAGETADRGEKLRLYQRAIDATSEAIRFNPAYDRAYYNRACYRTLVGGPVPEILADLREAIGLFPLNRLYARSDGDFDPIRKEPAFQSLVDEERKESGVAAAV
jgi:tetratricopeptide (TPR) repeat protein